ncbi:hypothetical protein [Actinacidiphila acididurans]|uniref:Secreted protein n=1 Tax=Actinacidiphila acididurans TaxID=2784346 RepID=A0ABS2U0A5_9ACTN|nr:hypothetical protein [Actinacidiphila acididurans]MBM9508752.1 hypothetical protein [Actinacidiphila acididurans]
MTGVRRGAFRVLVWAVATAASVTLSWFGVHSVLRGTAYDLPRALPITGVPTSSPPPAAPSPTRRPTPEPTPTAATPPAARTTARPPAHPARSAPSPSATPSPDAGTVRAWTMHGGRVVLDLAPASASLVSATPDQGWQMQLWTSQPGWLRVTFTSASGSAASTVICTWNGHPPTVQAFES